MLNITMRYSKFILEAWLLLFLMLFCVLDRKEDDCFCISLFYVYKVFCKSIPCIMLLLSKLNYFCDY